jgi:hypothetical protein
MAEYTMVGEPHDPLQHVTQLRQILSADKLSIGFFLGAGCPCAVRMKDGPASPERPLIPDIRGLTTAVQEAVAGSADHAAPYKKLITAFADDGETAPTVEAMLNRIRALRDVAGRASVRNLSFDELDGLDKEICSQIRKIVTCDLPIAKTPYHAMASFIRTHRYPFSEIFTTNYDVLIEQALERDHVPYFDGFIGSSRPFFDQRAIEDGEIPPRWSRLWKLHGSINWRYNKNTKTVVRSDKEIDGDELLIHPSHMKYDESRRMPYFVMIDRLRAFLRHEERPVALIILGYSFGDQHLNEAIVESLKINSSSACFALQFGALDQYPVATALAKDNSNLSLFARDSAIVRRREGPWIASAATDVSKLGAMFEKLPPPAAAAEALPSTDATDAPQPCAFAGGDFKHFGEFLEDFSAYDAHGTVLA